MKKLAWRFTLFTLFLVIGLVTSDVRAIEIELKPITQPDPVETVKKMETELTKAKSGTLWVKSADGTSREVPIEELSESAQEYIKTLAKIRTVDETMVRSDKIQITVRSLKVNKPAPAPPKPLTSDENEPFAWMGHGSKATTISLLLSSPKQQIISLDDHASKITQFTDNLGTNLWGGSHSLSFKAEKGHDGHLSSIDVTGFEIPAPGATKIKLKGDLVFLCVSGKKTIEKKVKAAKKETNISIGKTEIGLSTIQVATPVTTTGNKKIEVYFSQIQLTSSEPLDFVQSIEFYDADGKKIHPQGQSSTGGGGRNSLSNSNFKFYYTKYYNMTEKLDTFTMKITYYEKNEQIIVPVDLETSLGF